MLLCIPVSICLYLCLPRPSTCTGILMPESCLTWSACLHLQDFPFILVGLAPGLSNSGDSFPAFTICISLLCLHLTLTSSIEHGKYCTPTRWARLYLRAWLYFTHKKTLVPEAMAVRQTFSSFGGRPRFRGLCSWALLRHLEPLSAEPEVTLFFPSPMFFFTFPSDRLSLRFSSPEFGLLLSSLELRRFLSSAEVWDDVWKFNNNNDNHYNSHYHHCHQHGPHSSLSFSAVLWTVFIATLRNSILCLCWKDSLKKNYVTCLQPQRWLYS